MMFLTYLAAFAAPAPAAEGPKFDLAEDIPIICRLRFDDNLNRLRQGKSPDSPIIEMYAERAGISEGEKVLVLSFCQMFDLGAMHLIELQGNSSSDDGDSTSEPYVTSFVR